MTTHHHNPITFNAHGHKAATDVTFPNGMNTSPAWFASCDCGWSTSLVGQLQQAVDAMSAHVSGSK